MYRKKIKKIHLLTAYLLVIIFSSITLVSCLSIPKFFAGLTEEQFINLQNKVNSQAVKSTIKIVTTINSLDGTKQELGSGVIVESQINQDSTYTYYALTNYHVIADASTTLGWYQERGVYDYKNNKYQRYKILAINKDYDLALIMFKGVANGEFLPALKRANTNPTKKSLVIALGYPMGQVNSVTYGKVVGYNKVNVQQENGSVKQTNFSALSHSAPGNHGSSGGPIINTQLELVGLNFAGGKADASTGYSRDMWGIPIEIINKFISSIEG